VHCKPASAVQRISESATGSVTSVSTTVNNRRTATLV
jgi:hypothetical protein